MIEKLNNEIIKRRQAACQFYYRGVGQAIRKRRLELNMTQEAVSIGICSNTYLSKIENNQIEVNREHLYLLMERVGMPMEKITFPEEMIEYLERAINYFFFYNIEDYKLLFEEVDKYQFAVLLQIVKLGYYILIEDEVNAGLIYNEIFRYLSSLEEFGLSIFLIFASFYNIQVNNYKNAKIILDKIENFFHNDDIIYGLYNFSRYLICGNLHLNMTANESGIIAFGIFSKYSNLKRLKEYYLWKEIFMCYEGNVPEKNFDFKVLDHTSLKLSNYYLIILSTRSKKPLTYLRALKREGDNYLLGLFIKARYFLLNNEMEEFKKTYTEINNLHYKVNSNIDYTYILKLLKNNEDILLKDYLINYCLELATKKQNIYLAKIITLSISDILVSKKRYKDALNYRQKFDDLVLSLQLTSKLSLK